MNASHHVINCWIARSGFVLCPVIHYAFWRKAACIVLAFRSLWRKQKCNYSFLVSNNHKVLYYPVLYFSGKLSDVRSRQGCLSVGAWCASLTGVLWFICTVHLRVWIAVMWLSTNTRKAGLLHRLISSAGSALVQLTEMGAQMWREVTVFEVLLVSSFWILQAYEKNQMPSFWAVRAVCRSLLLSQSPQHPVWHGTETGAEGDGARSQLHRAAGKTEVPDCWFFSHSALFICACTSQSKLIYLGTFLYLSLPFCNLPHALLTVAARQNLNRSWFWTVLSILNMCPGRISKAGDGEERESFALPAVLSCP